jgi:hypothetical protein
MGAVVTATSQFLEQADRRAPFASRQLVFGFEDLGQRLDP